MLSLANAILGLSLLAQQPVAEPAAPPPARSYVSALAVRGSEALRFEIRSPRMSTEEYGKTVADAEIRAALNRLHLSDLGTLTASCACTIAGRLIEEGSYRVALWIESDGRCTLLLEGAARSVHVPLEPAAGGASHVPQLAIAFLAHEEIDRFALEVRFGPLRGTALLAFSAEELVSGMNNLAYELLTAANAGADASSRALLLATRANALTEGRIPQILDTLALAQFQNGRVADAIQTQRRAIEILGPEITKERAQLAAQLERFEKSARPAADAEENSN
ncbi:MAG: hypothetical protein HY812_11760 [Planctomycetes bacterium]|nr:hypothetical protein [Planctomycetota bacterium]